jgi:hypothetical protein
MKKSDKILAHQVLEKDDALRAYIIIFSLIAFLFLSLGVYYALTTPKVCFGSSVLSDCVFVEVADSPEELIKGLGGHKPLRSMQGMIFVFSEPGRHDFWMKDVSFPIDILWVDKDSVVSIVESAEPCPDNICEVYKADGIATFVVELPAGYVDEHGIKTGDMVSFKEEIIST